MIEMSFVVLGIYIAGDMIQTLRRIPLGGYHLSGEAFFLQAVHPQMNKSTLADAGPIPPEQRHKKKREALSRRKNLSLKVATTYSPTVTQYHRRDKA